MNSFYKLQSGVSGMLILACLLVPGLACSPRPAPGLLPSDSSDEELLQITCEKNLSYLRILIEDKLEIKKIQSFRIIEAREIFQLAQILYLQQEYSLAMELIENAIDILEETGD